MVQTAGLFVSRTEQEVDDYLRLHPDATEPPDYWGIEKIAAFEAKRGDTARERPNGPTPSHGQAENPH